MNELKCPECSGKIKLGIAINPGVIDTRVCFYSSPLLNHKTIKMIDVYKCTKCGYSCDHEEDLMELK